jgi:acyl-CoA dehydrogenase
MTMDFTPTEAQQALTALTAEILRDRVSTGRLRELEAGADRFDPQLWETLAETGVLSAALPSEAGGDGHGVLEMCSVLVELGRSLAPVPYLPTIALAGSVLARVGTAQQQADWLKPALAGRLILAVALAEPHSVTPLAPSTRAEPTATGWSLTGTKTTLAAGPLAQLILVSATTPDGPRLFAISPDDPGVRISRQQMINQDDAGWLELTAVPLPSSRIIGPPPGRIGKIEDAEVLTWLVRHGTTALCAQQLGVLERALELTAEYAASRTQFDRPIGSFQAVGQRLADAYIQVQALRLAVWNAAWSLDAWSRSLDADAGLEAADLDQVSEEAVDRASSIAGFWATEAGHYVAHTCVHIHGGTGLDVEHPLHRYFLAAKRTEFDLGGPTAHLLALGTQLAEPD